MRSALFVTVAVLLCYVSLADLQPCNVDDFKAAQNDFAETLQLSDDDDWHHPIQLLEAIHIYYGNNTVEGLLNVCNAYNKMLNDLKNKNVDAATCFDPFWLLKSDDTPDDAVNFAGVSGYLRYQCGAGFYPVVSRWDSVAKVYQTKTPALVKILRDTLRDARTDTKNRCTIIEDQKYKYRKLFQDQTADYQISYFACQSANWLFANIYGECANNCDLHAPQPSV
ncbi:hypothetical protein M3Y96_00492800 [Aphelenchoides besseyi]|nr:hypothetical protein M3Y96_00492800 [Aphelenchoides besseyi]